MTELTGKASHETGSPYVTTEYVICKIEIWDENHDYTDATALTIKINDATGTEKLAATDATGGKDATGKYHYDYTIPASPEYGMWEIQWKITDADGRVTIIRDHFEVKS